MDKTVLISLPVEDLQSLIVDCVNSCLKHNQPPRSNSSESPDQLLTIKEAAEFLNLTVPTIYSKVSRAELPVMKRSKRLYFSRTELLEYLKEGRKKTSAELDREAVKHLNGNKKGG